MQTRYISGPGDFTDAVNSLPVADTSLERNLLSGIEVESAGATQAIIAFGDSITDCYNSTVAADSRWPDQLAARLSARMKTGDYTVVNEGISGNRVLNGVLGSMRRRVSVATSWAGRAAP